MNSLVFLAAIWAYPVVGFVALMIACRFGGLSFADRGDFICKLWLWPIVLVAWIGLAAHASRAVEGE